MFICVLSGEMLVPLIISALVSAILCAALLRNAYGRHILCICAAWGGFGRRRAPLSGLDPARRDNSGPCYFYSC
jgi:hypothetical protein